MKEKMYSLAIRKRKDSNDYFWNHKDFEFTECKIDCEGRYWLADPFLYEKSGKTYIFYEAYDLVLKRGFIGYSIYNEKGSPSKVNIVISETYHLSYPYIFESEGNIYIMPETSADYSLHVYEAKSFPDVWVRKQDVIADVYACDSIFIRYDNKRYLLTNEMYHNTPMSKFASCWVKNYLYEVNGLVVNNYEGTLVAEGEYGIRNAGNIIYTSGKTYRIGQDCRFSKYGRGLVLFEIHNINPYQEEVVNSWDFEYLSAHIKKVDANELVGVHTYNLSQHYEIIDFSQIKKLSRKVIVLRKVLKIKNIIYRVCHLFMRK